MFLHVVLVFLGPLFDKYMSIHVFAEPGIYVCTYIYRLLNPPAPGLVCPRFAQRLEIIIVRREM